MEDTIARDAILHLARAMNSLSCALNEFRQQWQAKGYDHDLLLQERMLERCAASIATAVDMLTGSLDGS